MKIGTKSVLYGAHAFWAHPFFVFGAWWKLYGFPWDPRLWVAFFVHDIGYWGRPNMDGPEGEAHPEWGAGVVGGLFDTGEALGPLGRLWVRAFNSVWGWVGAKGWNAETWYEFVLYHSRFLARHDGMPHSALCVADKLAICLTPWWLYLPMARATGEVHEYRALGKDESAANKYASMSVWDPQEKQWYLNVQAYLRSWVAEHKDGRADTWTPDVREANDDTGTWK